MSPLPNALLFLHNFMFLFVVFSRHCFGTRISAMFVIVGVVWGLYWDTVGSLFGDIFRVFEKGLPGESGSVSEVVSRLPRGGSKTPLS